jgi:pyruvate dehydrogenase E1 component alpha subunit
VSVTYFGDGAANQGQVYETFNMASIWKLPVIFVIENNRYAMGTSAQRSTAMSEQLGARGAAFGIPSAQVDGMDVRAVKEAADAAIEHCRSGEGPYILEMMTYRYRGHSMSDPAKYRAKEEVQKMREEHDPIEQVKARILKAGMASEDELKKIDGEIRAIVIEAAEFAQGDPEPDVSELWTDIYVAS